MKHLLERLLAEGSRFYASDAMAESAGTYHRACEVAKALGDGQAEIFARFWEGCAHHGAGRLRAALVAMAPVLGRSDVSLADADVYRVATRYLRALVELPAERGAIERGLEQVERGVLDGGHPEWRSRGLLVRARLALSTGEWRECRRLAREALAGRRTDPFGCTLSSHHWEAVLASIWLGDLERADQWLDEWGGVEPLLTSQHVYRAWLRSCWLRRSGRAPEAVDHARMAYAEARAADDYPTGFTSAVELARVLLTLGDVASAREPLGELLRGRHTEIAEHAFVVRVLAADTRLAQARTLAGLPGLDLEFHQRYEPVRGARRIDLGAARRALARADVAYRRLAPRARVLDEALACRLREWQLADRAASLERTREEIG